MQIDPAAQTIESAIRTHRREILDLLRGQTPLQAALVMEGQGWPREWACKAIRQLEIQQNPANLQWGPEENQRRRDKLSLQVFGGIALVGIGVIFTLVKLLVFGRITLAGLGMAVAGAVMWSKAAPELKRLPDRMLPTYTPPKDLRGHQPGQY